MLREFPGMGDLPKYPGVEDLPKFLGGGGSS